MAKKYKIVILAFVIVLSFSACKGREKEEKASDTPKKESLDTENTVPDSWRDDTEDSFEDKNETANPSGNVPETSRTPETSKTPEKAETLETPEKAETSDMPEKTETADPSGQTPATEEKPDYEGDEGWLPWV